MNQSTQEAVFVETFETYGDAIFRFCLVKVSNRELAEDMTQEVFIKYWQYVRTGAEMTNTRSLLYTIANNLAKDWYKKKKADSLDQRMESGSIPIDQTAGPEATAQYYEVLDTIAGMEETDKTVLMLTHVEGLSPHDIATIIGTSANTVSVRLHRAMKRLQTKLGI